MCLMEIEKYESTVFLNHVDVTMCKFCTLMMLNVNIYFTDVPLKRVL